MYNYGGFVSRSHGRRVPDRSSQMQDRPFVNQNAGGKSSWERSNLDKLMQKGRRMGFHYPRESIKSEEMSFGAAGNGNSFHTIKKEPGIERLEEAGNLCKSSNDFEGSASTSTIKNAGCTYLPLRIKKEPGSDTTLESRPRGLRKPVSRTIVGDAQNLPKLMKIEPGVDGFMHKVDTSGGVEYSYQPSVNSSCSDTKSKPTQDNWQVKEPLSEELDAEANRMATYNCECCNISCNSEASYREHVNGKRHLSQQKQKKEIVQTKKNKLSKPKHVANIVTSRLGLPRKRPTNPLPRGSFRSVMRLLCETEDVVGMQYVTQYRKFGTDHCRYMCELCDYLCSMKELVDHMICRKHRMRYARIHLFNAYARMSDYPSFKNMMLPAQLDRFLAHVCARVVNADRVRGMRACRTKEYINESDIGIDISLFNSAGKRHPSLLEDLVIAETILEEADLIGQNSPMQLLRSRKPPSLRHEDVLTELSEPAPINARIQRTAITLNQNIRRSVFLERKRRSILQSLEANARSAKLYGLTATSVKERESLLKHLKATNSRIQDLRVIALAEHSTQIDSEFQDVENSSPLPTLLPKREHPPIKEEIPAKRIKDEAVRNTSLLFSPLPTLLPNRRREDPLAKEDIPIKRIKDEAVSNTILSDSLTEIQKAVEPIIAETRRRVEQKIYEAMESGNLSSVLEALQNNPNMHDTLQKWENDQQTKEDNGPSHGNLGNNEGYDDYPDPEYSDAGPSKTHSAYIDSHGYPEYFDAGQVHRYSEHAEDLEYSEYNDAGPSHGNQEDHRHTIYSQAGRQRQTVQDVDAEYPEYYGEMDAGGSSNFEFVNHGASYSTLFDANLTAVRGRPIHNTRRQGLLGERPSPSTDSTPLNNRRYRQADW